MRSRIHIVLGLFAAAAPALAQPGNAALPVIPVSPFVAECAHPALPSQRQVADWTGLHNVGQVYAARARLMARIGRACQQPRVGRVEVVMRPAPNHGAAARRLAREIPGH